MATQKSKLTLLIPLKDRAEMTQRICKYFFDINIPYEVVFADGSIGDENEIFLNDSRIKSKLRYKYIRYPKDESLTKFYEKFKNSVNIVETPYIILVDNDDFPIISNIEKAIKFLDEHHDYIGCAGRVGTVKESKDRDAFFIANFTDDYEICRNISITGLERIENYQKDCPYFHYYAVFRTNNVIKTAEVLVNVNPSDILICELLTNYMMCVQGKIEELTCLTYVRDLMTSMTGELRMSKDYLERAIFDNIIEDYRKTVECVINELILRGEGKHEELRTKLYKILVKYPNLPFIPNKPRPVKFKLAQVFNIPRILRIINRNIFKLFPRISSKISQLTMKGQCTDEELKAIIDAIKKH